MKPLRLMCSVCLLFFLWMALVTFLSVNRNYNSLTQVSLTAAQKNAEGLYQLPLSSVSTDAKGQTFLFFVLEKEGAWGKEYICKKTFLGPVQLDPQQGSVLVREQQLPGYPIVASSEKPLTDGERVRFYKGSSE